MTRNKAGYSTIRTVAERTGYRLISSILAFAVLAELIASAPAAASSCKLGALAEFPITMVGLRPLMTARIDDVDVQFVVDSGAFYSVISAGSAAQLKLPTTPAPFGFELRGVHGATDVSVAKVKTFVLDGVPLHNVEFLVGGSEAGQGSIGLLGQNVLHIGDVEYDLGQGMVRLMKPQDCTKAMLGYWVNPSTPYSMIDILSDYPLSSQAAHFSRTIGHAYVNGTEIRAVFDSGAATSILSLRAAARVGVKPDSPGVVSGGASYGVGKDTFATYVAPISSFKIGEEEIKNTRIRIGDVELSDADMLIGADFFLSHHIYVANSQRKVYFTYNGGPVFNLTAGSHAAAGPAGLDAASDDAADYYRRGAAFASRREYDQALSALTRACELAPDKAEYFYERGMVYWQMKQSAPAMADLDQALKLKTDDLRAHIARAELLLQRGDKDLAVTDLDAADAIAPKESDERFQIAHAYERAGRLAPALAQLTLWIDSHTQDARLPYALNSRCWIRALGGTELKLALKDCNAAREHADKTSAFYSKLLDSRGLVLLRLGDYKNSIADYDASIKLNPRDAWSLYGRGIDKLRTQQSKAGDEDIAQAKAIWPQVAEEFKQRGIVP